MSDASLFITLFTLQRISEFTQSHTLDPEMVHKPPTFTAEPMSLMKPSEFLARASPGVIAVRLQDMLVTLLLDWRGRQLWRGGDPLTAWRRAACRARRAQWRARRVARERRAGQVWGDRDRRAGQRRARRTRTRRCRRAVEALVGFNVAKCGQTCQFPQNHPLSVPIPYKILIMIVRVPDLPDLREPLFFRDFWIDN